MRCCRTSWCRVALVVQRWRQSRSRQREDRLPGAAEPDWGSRPDPSRPSRGPRTSRDAVIVAGCSSHPGRGRGFLFALGGLADCDPVDGPDPGHHGPTFRPACSPTRGRRVWPPWRRRPPAPGTSPSTGGRSPCASRCRLPAATVLFDQLTPRTTTCLLDVARRPALRRAGPAAAMEPGRAATALAGSTPPMVYPNRSWTTPLRRSSASNCPSDVNDGEGVSRVDRDRPGRPTVRPFTGPRCGQRFAAAGPHRYLFVLAMHHHQRRGESSRSCGRAARSTGRRRLAPRPRFTTGHGTATTRCGNATWCGARAHLMDHWRGSSTPHRRCSPCPPTDPAGPPFRAGPTSAVDAAHPAPKEVATAQRNATMFMVFLTGRRRCRATPAESDIVTGTQVAGRTRTDPLVGLFTNTPRCGSRPATRPSRAARSGPGHHADALAHQRSVRGLVGVRADCSLAIWPLTGPASSTARSRPRARGARRLGVPGAVHRHRQAHASTRHARRTARSRRW